MSDSVESAESCTYIHYWDHYNNRRDNHAAPNYKNSHPLVITLQVSRYPDKTFGECIKKWRLEQGLFQRDMAKMIGVDEMTIVNWEKEKTKPTKRNLERLKAIFGATIQILFR